MKTNLQSKYWEGQSKEICELIRENLINIAERQLDPNLEWEYNWEADQYPNHAGKFINFEQVIKIDGEIVKRLGRYHDVRIEPIIQELFAPFHPSIEEENLCL